MHKKTQLVSIRTTEQGGDRSLEFYLNEPVTDELVEKAKVVEGVSHARSEYPYTFHVRIARQFDLRTVAVAVSGMIVTHFGWEPDAVYVSVDGDPLDSN